MTDCPSTERESERVIDRGRNTEKDTNRMIGKENEAGRKRKKYRMHHYRHRSRARVIGVVVILVMPLVQS